MFWRKENPKEFAGLLPIYFDFEFLLLQNMQLILFEPGMESPIDSQLQMQVAMEELYYPIVGTQRLFLKPGRCWVYL